MCQLNIFDPEYPPNQCLVNKYTKKDYLGMHVEDKKCYGDIIAGLTLGSMDYLKLGKVQQEEDGKNERSLKAEEKTTTYQSKISNDKKASSSTKESYYYLKMEDCSLYVLKDEARQSYKHGIGRIYNGKRYKDENFERISLTFRHVIETRRKL